jgi:type III restriction enzyme
LSLKTIPHLIINSPYSEPGEHWKYHRETRTFTLEKGRRPAGYVIATEGSKSFDDPGRFVEIELVEQIRPRIRAWREANYPGITGTTRRLLEHWNDPEEREGRRFFFCQLEAMETLIWLTEGPEADRVGIQIAGDGGKFSRLCSKMATGSGKTVVMSMVCAWHILNKVAYPQDSRFSKNILIIAPGLTVRSRLQVLVPDSPGNYYDAFSIVPPGLLEQMRLGKVLVRNWHALAWDTEEKLKKKRSVDKRGAKSDEAYVREVLGEMATVNNLVVLNDEAHHAWRIPAEFKKRRELKELFDEATVWVSGLDRIHRARGIQQCYDFSATPFAPSGKQSYEEALFSWIVSDFGLNDAIESGLVKTPRVVIRDDGIPDAKSYKSKLYHIYDHVREDLNRSAEEQEPLPDLVMNGYLLLGKDWLATKEAWEKAGYKTPPVMITVANRVETSARIKFAFDRKKVLIEELCSPSQTLQIDSKVLDMAEAKEEGDNGGAEPSEEAEPEDQPIKKLTKAEQAEQLRRTVDTVGQVGEPGEQIQNVISVGMLSEGWDAKTVTHIFGLRAFSSQLLCEQVVGRGLRRTSYDVNPETGLFEPEYVNIFGVPFTFLPHEGGDDVVPPPPKPKTRIEPVKAREEYAITWPNIIRIDHVYRPHLTLDVKGMKALRINAAQTPRLAEMAPVVDGKPDVTKITEIDLADIASRFRLQKVIFEAARDIYDQMKPSWQGSKEYLLAQVIHLVEQFLTSKKIDIEPSLFEQDELRRRLLLALNMARIVQTVFQEIRFENTEALTPIFDTHKPIRATGDMLPWFTGKPCEMTKRSHVNFVVLDSTWEATEAFELDRNAHVQAWVKNDHLGFEIGYIWRGAFHKYRPDFIIRLADGSHFVLETKGKDDEQNQAKRRYLDEWCQAVNHHGGFGQWKWNVSRNPSDIASKLEKASVRDNQS